MVPEWKRNAKPIETNRLYYIYINIDLAAKLGEEMDGELKTLLAQVWSWDVRHGIAFYSWYMSSSEVFPNFWGGFSGGRCHVEWCLMLKFLMFVRVRVWVADQPGTWESRVRPVCFCLHIVYLGEQRRHLQALKSENVCSQKGTPLVVSYMADIVTVNLIEPHYPLTN